MMNDEDSPACIKLGGRLSSLWNNVPIQDYGCYKLFDYYNYYIKDVSELIFPNTTAEHCYEYMFGHNTGLITPPTLPATALAKSCYDSMFRGCTSLKVYSRAEEGVERA